MVGVQRLCIEPPADLVQLFNHFDPSEVEAHCSIGKKFSTRQQLALLSYYFMKDDFPQDLVWPGPETCIWEGELPDFSPFIDGLFPWRSIRKKNFYHIGERFVSWASRCLPLRVTEGRFQDGPFEQLRQDKEVLMILRLLVTCSLLGGYEDSPPVSWETRKDLWQRLVAHPMTDEEFFLWCSQERSIVVISLLEYFICLSRKVPGLFCTLCDVFHWTTLIEQTQEASKKLHEYMGYSPGELPRGFQASIVVPGLRRIIRPRCVMDLVEVIATASSREFTHVPVELLEAASWIPWGCIPWILLYKTLSYDVFQRFRLHYESWLEVGKTSSQEVRHLCSSTTDGGSLGLWFQALRRAWKTTFFYLPQHFMGAHREALSRRYNTTVDRLPQPAGFFYFSPVCGFKGFISQGGNHKSTAHGSHDVAFDTDTEVVYCSHRNTKNKRNNAGSKRASWELFEETPCVAHEDFLSPCDNIPCTLISLVGKVIQEKNGLITLCCHCGCPTFIMPNSWKDGLIYCPSCTTSKSSCTTCALCHQHQTPAAPPMKKVEVYDDMSDAGGGFRWVSICQYCIRRWMDQGERIWRMSELSKGAKDKWLTYDVEDGTCIPSMRS